MEAGTRAVVADSEAAVFAGAVAAASVAAEPQGDGNDENATTGQALAVLALARAACVPARDHGRHRCGDSQRGTTPWRRNPLCRRKRARTLGPNSWTDAKRTSH